MFEAELLSQWGIWFCFLSETAEGDKANEKYDDNFVLLYSIGAPSELAYLWNQSGLDSLANYLPRSDLRQKIYLVKEKWRKVNSLQFFKKGILPKWQDPENAKGGRFIFPINRGQDNNEEVYRSLVFFLIGEDFEHSQLINGFRFIASKNPHETYYRVEIWVKFDKTSNDSLIGLRGILANLFSDLNINLSSVDFKNNSTNEPSSKEIKEK